MSGDGPVMVAARMRREQDKDRYRDERREDEWLEDEWTSGERGKCAPMDAFLRFYLHMCVFFRNFAAQMCVRTRTRKKDTQNDIRKIHHFYAK